MDKPISLFVDADVDPKATHQFYEAMKQDFVLQGALMPDAHVGYTLPIGAAVLTKGVLVPSYLGFDIGCGVFAVALNVRADDVEKNLDAIKALILEAIPVGFNHHAKLPFDMIETSDFLGGKLFDEVFNDSGLKQLGTLGSGNHFLEIGTDENNVVWVVIHSGSRNVGHTIATHYMKIASGTGRAAEGHYPLAIDSPEGIEYKKDLHACYEFALKNRRMMFHQILDAIREATGISSIVMANVPINKVHNFANDYVPWIHRSESEGLMIHRKGATSANEGEFGVVPGNFRDGTYIVKGKGNNQALNSCSHGAGRLYGRKKAKEMFTMDDYQEAMKDSKVNFEISMNNIDESPMAYKDIHNVMSLQTNLVTIINHIEPMTTIKG